MPDDPPSDPPGSDDSPPITPEALRKYLSARDVVEHIRVMVKRRVHPQDVEDVVGEAILKMCASTALPREAAIGGWVEVSTLSVVTDHHRKGGRRARRETAVDDIDERAATAPDAVPDRTEWLRKRVAKSRIDTETLHIVDTQVEHDLTRAQVAARFGMSEEALKKRIQRFRAKYDDEWKRERTILALLWLLGLGAAGVIAWFVVHARAERPTIPIGPDPFPSTSASPADDGGNNIAAPPSSSAPTREKPKPP